MKYYKLETVVTFFTRTCINFCVLNFVRRLLRVLTKRTSSFEYITGLSKLLIGKRTIDVIECTMSGIWYPRKFLKENKIIGSQQTMSVATIRDTLQSSFFFFFRLVFRKFLSVS